MPKWKKYSFQYLIHYTAKSLKITCISAEYPFASIDIYCFIIEIKSITASLLNLNRRRKPSLVIQMDSIDRSISIKIYLFLIYWFSYHLTTTKFPPSFSSSDLRQLWSVSRYSFIFREFAKGNDQWSAQERGVWMSIWEVC